MAARARATQPPLPFIQFFFRKEHATQRIDRFFTFSRTLPEVFVVLDVDDGSEKVIESTAEEETLRRSVLKNQQLSVKPFLYSMDMEKARQQGEKEESEIELTRCLNAMKCEKKKSSMEEWWRVRRVRRRECARCRQKAFITSSVFLCSLPPILCIQLSRCNYFKNGGYKLYTHKVSTVVLYPLYDLDMKPYMKPEMVKEGEEYLYDLIGVSCHSGTDFEGHYFCICKDNVNGENEWIRYNDRDCVRIEEKDVQRPDACFLVYSRKNRTMSAQDVAQYIQQLKASQQ